MKKLLHYYSFDPANNTIVVEGIYRRERFLLITNVTTNQVIYTFNSATGGMAGYSINTSAETTTIVLDFDCSAMSSTDKLQIFIDQDFVNFEPSDTFVDPVSKIRVSEPSNLIDTDFEYGLQSTKWETLELVKNIPTIFARNGDADIPISSMTVATGSDTVTVTTSENHGFLAGSPIIILGSKNVSCDGGFIVINVLSTTQFQYKAKRPLSFTGTVKDTYTQLFAGSLYSGTEFDIGGIQGISTDANTSTKLTVSTVYPTNFTLNTSFFMSNSKATVKVKVDSALVQPNNYVMVSNTITNNVATGENSSFSLVSVQPYRYTPANSNEVLFFNNNQISVVSGNSTIIFPTPHGLIDNKPYLYVRGEENVAIGGMNDGWAYYVRVLSPTQIYLTRYINDTYRIPISQGQSGPSTRSAFIRAYGFYYVNYYYSSYGVWYIFDEAHGLTPGASTPIAFFRSYNADYYDSWQSYNLRSTNFINDIKVYYPSTDISYISGGYTATTTMKFTDVAGASTTLYQYGSLNYGVGYGPVMVKVSSLNDYYSMRFENISSLQTNDIVTFSAFQGGGAVPTGLANNTSYAIEKVSSNRIRFKDRTTGSIITLASIGSSNGVYTITANSTVLDSDTVYLENNTLKDGSTVLYSNNSNVTIGGLTDNTNYYVFQKSQNRFKLSTTTEGWAGAAKTITHSSAININNGYITLSSHGYSTQTAIQYTSSTPVNGLTNGGWYWVRNIDTNTFTLHFSRTGANNNTDLVQMVGPLSGTGNFRAANIVDLTSVSSGEQVFESSSPNAADGVYKIVEKIDDNTFLIESNNQIPLRTIDINPIKTVDLNRSAFYVPEHGLLPGTNTQYTTTGTPIGGLANGQNYFVSRISKDWFKLSSNLQNALANVTLTLANNGTGTTHTLKTSTISGEILGTGRITLLANSATIDGVGTNFPANYTSGDIIKIFETANVMTFNVSSIDTASDIITVASNHGMATNDSFFLSSDITPGGMTEDGIYYARVLTSTTLSAHPTPAAAYANTDRANITSSGTTVTIGVIKTLGSTSEREIETINGITRMELLEVSNTTFSNVEYAIGTSLVIRADGAALHRPYDGGVELIPSTNPDSTMIRQTRKYFRYQSGKGIQVSFAVNFSPSTTIDTLYRTGNVATVVTRNPHRMSKNLNITISGATVSSGNNYWNGVHQVSSIVDDYTFQFVLPGTPVDITADGLIEYYVNNWQNCLLKCGMFDDQNGLYFEYDGSTLYFCRRSSTQQISGTASVQFKSGEVVGNNTKFLSQLAVNQKIVIKGQTYLISKIVNNNLLYVLPTYRGSDATNVIITKIVDTKIPQSQWNLDVCDGTGLTGYYLDIHRIQMAYMDYSWYGAGKVRFGFKDQRGKVIYAHEFIHNNKFTEAYMRSGNIPARYEIENLGTPSYVPALAHWGTSVIMDGKFDDDKAYVFSAPSNSLSITGSSSLSITGSVESTQPVYVFVGNRWQLAGYGITLATASPSYTVIPAGISVTGTNVSSLTANPSSAAITPYQPYLPGVLSGFGSNFNPSSQSVRNLLLVRNVNGTSSSQTYTVALSSATSSVVYEQPLISIRLAPSVDNSTPGLLGEREIINRMQLILSSVGILTTHTCEVSLKLNGSLNTSDWQRVTNPSLSQLIYHGTSDRISGGTTIYTFRAGGSTGNTARILVNTLADLGEIATLGNSILGGNNPFPDGPDVLTVVAKLIEDPSNVSGSNPFNVSARISWSESQA